MYTDPISDLLTRIRNACKAKHSVVKLPYSKMKESIAGILVKKEYVASVKVNELSSNHKELEIGLIEGKNTINLKRVSSPGQRIYLKAPEVKKVRNGFGFAIYSTSSGVMTDEEARSQNCGGELLCEIY
jgi:small subunit ribosomal protein S8